MPSALELAAASILYQALEAPLGIGLIVRTGTESSLRGKAILYRFRREIGDPALMCLQIRLSPDDPEHELWIIRGAGPQPEPEPEPSVNLDALDL